MRLIIYGIHDDVIDCGIEFSTNCVSFYKLKFGEVIELEKDNIRIERYEH